jgi:hypothetical protein|tara:strand:- start:347 stop:592 length:246 start_codon:yes stop_codon:yes gene_type:complete
MTVEQKQKLILLTDFIETKVRKEKELEYYQKQLEELKTKMFYLSKEINLTNDIIEMVQSESVVDVREQLLSRQQSLLPTKK